MLREFAWLTAVALIAIAVAVNVRRRCNRFKADYQAFKEYADTLLQHGQGTILNVQGILSELKPENPTRQRIEQVLTRAERELAELSETMHAHCSKQHADASDD